MMLNEIIVLIFGIIIAVTILLMLRKIFFGSRKNLNSGNGAGGAYCVNANSYSERGKWMMWWR